MIEAILPCGVATAELLSDVPEDGLFPEERFLVARAVPKRRAEFTAARVCARRALAQLGFPPVPILSGPNREPLWPQGTVGSLTHCPGYHAAAVAEAPPFKTIGIDAEPNEPLPEGILAHVSLPVEREQLSAAGAPHPDRLLFSAKEAVYKAWFPLAFRWLGFHDAEIALGRDGTFAARLLVPGPIGRFSGRWLAHAGIVVTAIVVDTELSERSDSDRSCESPRHYQPSREPCKISSDSAVRRGT